MDASKSSLQVFEVNRNTMKAVMIAALFNLVSAYSFGQAPIFAWARQAGGTAGSSNGIAIAVDGSGNSYVTGNFQGSAAFGNTTLISTGGSHDIFVAKYDVAGNVVWAKKAGGTNGDSGSAIAIDGSGDIYVTGAFYGTATFDSTTFSSTGLEDIFIAKYDDTGNVVWARRAGGISTDAAYGIAVDGSGNSYITGDFFGSASFGSTTLTSAGSLDFFMAKYDAAGNIVWVKRAGGTDDEYGYGIVVDGSGNSYLTGAFYGTAAFGSTTLSNTSSFYDVFVAKFDAAGNVVWAKRAGGTNGDSGSAIAIDGSGNSYVTGAFVGAATFGSTTFSSVGGSYDIFVAKYDAAGNVVWARRAGGTDEDSAYGIAVDGSGNSYVTGEFAGTAIFGSTTLISAGSLDFFMAKYDAAGNIVWAKRAGGTDDEYGYGIVVDGSGNSYVTGRFTGTATFGSTTLTSNGFSDIFIARLANYTSTSEEVSLASFTIWPNPFASAFQLKLTSSAGTNATVMLSDMLGREVHRQQLTASESPQTVTPPSGLPAGMYLLQVIQGQEVRQLRVVRE